MVNKKERGINHELFQKHFKIQGPIDMLKVLLVQMTKRKTTI